MKYIVTQTGDKCINCYHISTFSVKELSVYAKLKDQKIRLGTFNTKEDAKTEFDNIIKHLEYKMPYTYQVSSEKDMISKRVMNEVNDLFTEEGDRVTVDFNKNMFEIKDDLIDVDDFQKSKIGIEDDDIDDLNYDFGDVEAD